MTVMSALIISMLASAISNIGIIFQKKGVNKVSGKSNKATIKYITNGTWITGLALMTAGWIFYLAAMRYAPISVIQPLQGFGFLVFVAFSIFYLHERIRPTDWAAVACMLLGILILGYSTSGAGGRENFTSTPLLLLNLVLFLLFAILYILIKSGILKGFRIEVFWGMVSGSIMGLAALYTKAMLTYAGNNDFFTAFAVYLPVVILVNIAGLLAMQRGFQTGTAIIVLSIQSVLNSVIPVIGGMLSFSERLSSNPPVIALQIAGFLMVISGTAVISKFTKQV